MGFAVKIGTGRCVEMKGVVEGRHLPGIRRGDG